MGEHDDPIERIEARQVEITEALDALNIASRGQSFSEAQQSEWDALSEEFDTNDETLTELRAEQRQADLRAERIAAARARYGSIQVSPHRDSVSELFEGDMRTLDDRTAVQRAQRVLDADDIAGHLRADQKTHVRSLLRTQTADTDGGLLARYMLATSDPHYRSAFQKISTSLTPVFEPDEARAVERVRLIKRAMSVGSPGGGGYAVPVLIDPTIILTAQGSENDILRMCRVETITNDTWRGLSSAGVSWKFGAEASASTDNSPTLLQPEVPTARADGFIPFSIEIGMDWAGFAESMSGLLALGYDELLSEYLTTGDGSDAPTGLVYALAAQTSPDVSTTLGTAATMTGGDIYDLWGRLPQRHRRKGSCAWMSSTDVQNTIRQLGTTDPNFTVNITAESVPALFGKPYPMNDYMDDMPAGTGAENLLVVGDFKGYLVAQRAGMSIEYIPHLFDVTNNRPTGQRGWYAYARVGADVVDPTAFQLLTNKSS